MKRQKHLSQNNNALWIGIVSAVVIIIILIIAFSGNKSANLEETELVEQTQEEVQDVVVKPEPVQGETLEAIKEETTPVNTEKIGEEGLCEDYFFEQGDSLEILDHKIIVDRIGREALRLTVDGQNYALGAGETQYLGAGIKLGIAENKILYFGVDDSSNAAVIRVGCSYDENPNEKYVQSRGKVICQQVYESCQSSFGIDLSD